jgi:hypothetical protein
MAEKLGKDAEMEILLTRLNRYMTYYFEMHDVYVGYEPYCKYCTECTAKYH